MLENTNNYDEREKKILTICSGVVGFWISCFFIGLLIL